MRYITAFVVTALLFLCIGTSQGADKNKSVPSKQAQADQQRHGPKLDATSLEGERREGVKEASGKQDPSAEKHLENEGRLVEYTRQLAVDTNSLAKLTFWICIANALTALIAVGQFLMFRQQLKHMGIDTQVTRDTLIADQRPWIALDVEIASPLACDNAGWDAGVRWHIEIDYKMRHIGKTPATNVSVYGSITPFTIPQFPEGVNETNFQHVQPEPGTDVQKELNAICDFPEQLSGAKLGFGQVIFPGDSRSARFGFNGDPVRFDGGRIVGTYTGQFLLTICVTYGSSISNQTYRTAKAFLLHKSRGGNIDLNGETIPPQNLQISLFPTNGSIVT